MAGPSLSRAAAVVEACGGVSSPIFDIFENWEVLIIGEFQIAFPRLLIGRLIVALAAVVFIRIVGELFEVFRLTEVVLECVSDQPFEGDGGVVWDEVIFPTVLPQLEVFDIKT